MAGPGDGKDGPLAVKPVEQFGAGNQVEAAVANGGAGSVGQFAESGKRAEANVVGNPAAGAGGDTVSISETNKILDVVQPNPEASAEGFREGGVNDTTHRNKQPRRNRNGTRGKRQYKP